MQESRSIKFRHIGDIYFGERVSVQYLQRPIDYVQYYSKEQNMYNLCYQDMTISRFVNFSQLFIVRNKTQHREKIYPPQRYIYTRGGNTSSNFLNHSHLFTFIIEHLKSLQNAPNVLSMSPNVAPLCDATTDLDTIVDWMGIEGPGCWLLVVGCQLLQVNITGTMGNCNLI